MYCKFCGRNLDPGAGQCPACGRPAGPLTGGTGFWDLMEPEERPAAPTPPAPAKTELPPAPEQPEAPAAPAEPEAVAVPEKAGEAPAGEPEEAGGAEAVREARSAQAAAEQRVSEILTAQADRHKQNVAARLALARRANTARRLAAVSTGLLVLALVGVILLWVRVGKLEDRLAAAQAPGGAEGLFPSFTDRAEPPGDPDNPVPPQQHGGGEEAPSGPDAEDRSGSEGRPEPTRPEGNAIRPGGGAP